MRKLVSILISVTIMLFAFVGCAEDAALNSTKAAPSYEEVMTTINDFEDTYSNYLRNNQDKLIQINSEGNTPSGVPCSSLYLTTEDKAISSCSLQITYEDRMCIDEYFLINDSTLFIAHSDNVPTDGTFGGELSKYIIIDGTLYLINETEQTVSVVDHPDTLDFYLSFSEITELYGKNA